MRIKILTFHNELNYGANLQAFALVRFLHCMGHQVEFLDYSRKRQAGTAAKRWLARSPRRLITKWRRRLFEIQMTPIFERFQSTYLPTTSHNYQGLDSLRHRSPEADCLIVGSDQVWSNEIVSLEDMPAYLLAFGDKCVRRVSFAASSGGASFPSSYQAEWLDLIKAFDYVSVREPTLRKYLSQLGVHGVKQIFDPTILIDWSKYVLLPVEPRLNATGVFFLNQESYSRVQLDYGDIDDFSFTVLWPFDWIRRIARTRLLLTDSYHAILFAIYTHTPFIFVRWGSNVPRDERVTSTLEYLGLGNRACFSLSSEDREMAAENSMHWPSVDAKLCQQRVAAEAFLKTALEM